MGIRKHNVFIEMLKHVEDVDLEEELSLHIDRAVDTCRQYCVWLRRFCDFCHAVFDDMRFEVPRAVLSCGLKF